MDKKKIPGRVRERTRKARFDAVGHCGHPYPVFPFGTSVCHRIGLTFGELLALGRVSTSRRHVADEIELTPFASESVFFALNLSLYDRYDQSYVPTPIRYNALRTPDSTITAAMNPAYIDPNFTDLGGHRRTSRNDAATGASAAGVRALSAQMVAFYFRAPIKAFFRTRVEYVLCPIPMASVLG